MTKHSEKKTTPEFKSKISLGVCRNLRISGEGSSLIKKVPLTERLSWQFNISEHPYSTILQAESPVPARGVWAIQPRAFGEVPKYLRVFVKKKNASRPLFWAQRYVRYFLPHH